DILATSSSEASSNLEAAAMGALTAAIAGAHSEVSGATEVEGNSTGSIYSGAALTMKAKSTSFAKAESDAATGGFLLAFTITEPEAYISGRTETNYDGDITNATTADILSDATNTADSTSYGFTAGLISAQAERRRLRSPMTPTPTRSSGRARPSPTSAASSRS